MEIEEIESRIKGMKRFGVQVETMEEGQKAFVSMGTLVNYIHERVEGKK